MADTPKPEETAKIDHKSPLFQGWMDTPTEIRPGIYCYGGNPKNLKYVDMPNPREWNPLDDDWKLPENWEEIIREGFKDRLDRFRSFKLFMDICVRCGACADKCHFFIGSGDPKNMPVMRA
ncbi:MAG: (Fe-S)-binding protein, partial [Desulfobacteraceae bacterium]|nr:(Fe-S)-binding protein [Desulfobacteraceae bacterium]